MSQGWLPRWPGKAEAVGAAGRSSTRIQADPSEQADQRSVSAHQRTDRPREVHSSHVSAAPSCASSRRAETSRCDLVLPLVLELRRQHRGICASVRPLLDQQVATRATGCTHGFFVMSTCLTILPTWCCTPSSNKRSYDMTRRTSSASQLGARRARKSTRCGCPGSIISAASGTILASTVSI